MLRLLLIAPTCDADDVGEAWSTYQWVSRLAEVHDVTLVTYHKRGHRPASKQLAGVRVIEWVEPRLIGRTERLNSMLKPGYAPFYFRSRRWITDALGRGERFDIAHQLAPLALRYPCPATGLGVPYILGPVGGSLHSPPAFNAEERGTPWFVELRKVDRWRLRHDLLLRRSYEQASCVLGIAEYVQELLSGIALRRFEIMNDSGVTSLQPRRSDRPVSADLRALFVGRVIRTKGVRDAVRAMALLPDLPLTLDIVGDGNDRAACEELSRDLGLSGRITFHGRLSRQRVDEFFRRADFFLFPSYREPGGIVVSEAMSFGLPLIVCSRGGPASTTDDTCAIRIEARSPEQYAVDLADAVRCLATDRDLRIAMGDAALRRIGEIGLWEKKVSRVSSLYSEILAAQGAD